MADSGSSQIFIDADRQNQHRKRIDTYSNSIPHSRTYSLQLQPTNSIPPRKNDRKTYDNSHSYTPISTKHQQSVSGLTPFSIQTPRIDMVIYEDDDNDRKDTDLHLSNNATPKSKSKLNPELDSLTPPKNKPPYREESPSISILFNDTQNYNTRQKPISALIPFQFTEYNLASRNTNTTILSSNQNKPINLDRKNLSYNTLHDTLKNQEKCLEFYRHLTISANADIANQLQICAKFWYSYCNDGVITYEQYNMIVFNQS